MKILWLVNIVMPELAVHLGEKPSVFGGWLNGALDAARSAGHHITVCTTRSNGMEVRFQNRGKIRIRGQQQGGGVQVRTEADALGVFAGGADRQAMARGPGGLERAGEPAAGDTGLLTQMHRQLRHHDIHKP